MKHPHILSEEKEAAGPLLFFFFLYGKRDCCCWALRELGVLVFVCLGKAERCVCLLCWLLKHESLSEVEFWIFDRSCRGCFGHSQDFVWEGTRPSYEWALHIGRNLIVLSLLFVFGAFFFYWVEIEIDGIMLGYMMMLI